MCSSCQVLHMHSHNVDVWIMPRGKLKKNETETASDESLIRKSIFKWSNFKNIGDWGLVIKISLYYATVSLTRSGPHIRGATVQILILRHSLLYLLLTDFHPITETTGSFTSRPAAEIMAEAEHWAKQLMMCPFIKEYNLYVEKPRITHVMSELNSGMCSAE